MEGGAILVPYMPFYNVGHLIKSYFLSETGGLTNHILPNQGKLHIFCSLFMNFDY